MNTRRFRLKATPQTTTTSFKAARPSNWAMIPGSMGTPSYIVVGKEHPMSFHSAPHGAGRRYSRTKARALFGMDDLSRAMAASRTAFESPA